MTIEENKLIASKEDRRLVETFMGYADGYLSKFIRWNDIMPVVERIEHLNDLGFYVEIFGRRCTIKSLDSLAIISDFHGSNSGSKIEAVWLAIVEFIKWHNQTTANA